MARGLNQSWGQETQGNPNRKVEQQGLNQRRAAQLHYQQGKTAQDVLSMSPDDWAANTGSFWDKSFIPDQYETAQILRAYEHYSPT